MKIICIKDRLAKVYGITKEIIFPHFVEAPVSKEPVLIPTQDQTCEFVYSSPLWEGDLHQIRCGFKKLSGKKLRKWFYIIYGDVYKIQNYFSLNFIYDSANNRFLLRTRRQSICDGPCKHQATSNLSTPLRFLNNISICLQYIQMMTSFSAGPRFHDDACMHQELPPWEWTSGSGAGQTCFQCKIIECHDQTNDLSFSKINTIHTI